MGKRHSLKKTTTTTDFRDSRLRISSYDTLIPKQGASISALLGLRSLLVKEAERL